MTDAARRLPTPRAALAFALAAAALAGCGAEVTGAAATTATLQAEQAEQAKAQKAQIEKKLGAALQAQGAAASAAGSQ